MNKENSGDIILSFAAFFQTVVLMLQTLLIDSSIVAHESSRNVSIVLSAIPIVLAMNYIINRRLILLLITYIIILFLIFFTLLFFPDNEQYLNSGAFYLLCINVPCFLCIASIRNVIILNKMMLNLSYIIFVLGIIYVSFIFSGIIIFSIYSQSFSYYLLLPAVVFANQKNIRSTIIFILICLMMLMLGSRGGLVAAVIYAISLLIIDIKNNRFLISVLIILGILSGSLLSLFNKLSDTMGVTSRTLNLLMQGEFTQFQTRNDIYSITWNSIMKSPLWGNGIYGDRVLLNGEYCHNILLEIWHNFGLIFGTGIILLLSITTVRVFKSSDNENKKLLLLFFCFGFIPLMVSGSYLDHPEFGLFIGSFFLISRNSYVERIL